MSRKMTRIVAILILAAMLAGAIFSVRAGAEEYDETAQLLEETSEEVIAAAKLAKEEAWKAAHIGDGRTVVLDPGHSSVIPSGSVPLGPGSGQMKAADTYGTSGVATGMAEYTLTMSICRQLRTVLEAKGYKVLLTHETNDTAHSCVDRAKVANDADADIFLRIHANGSDDRYVTGAMTICITPSNPFCPEQYAESRRLSEILLRDYTEETGIEEEYVWETDSMTGNNWAQMPCTILEMGYMTNPEEDRLMADPEFQRVMVAAIAKGIDNYFAEAEPAAEPEAAAESETDAEEEPSAQE